MTAILYIARYRNNRMGALWLSPSEIDAGLTGLSFYFGDQISIIVRVGDYLLLCDIRVQCE